MRMQGLTCFLATFYFVTFSKSIEDDSCLGSSCLENVNRYGKEINEWASKLDKEVQIALQNYKPCDKTNCSCHTSVIDQDLAPYRDGITTEQFEIACSKATKYQVINGELFREKNCYFPARCAGVEHYLKALAPKLPDLELALNTKDWPQINSAWGQKKAPVFSFSKALLLWNHVPESVRKANNLRDFKSQVYEQFLMI